MQSMKSASIKAQKIKKGFTLLEVLVAISIFSVVLTGVSGIFSNFVKNYKSTKIVQRNLENAQFAVNQMAKILRTSKLVSPVNNPVSSQAVEVYDYSQNLCFRFEFTGGNINKQTASANVGICGVYGAAEKMIYSNNAAVSTNGSFLYPIATDKANGSWHVGMITVLAVVSHGSEDMAKMQTTVSLRDYANAL